MSELKAIESATAVIEKVYLVYRKSEADKVIAELKKEKEYVIENTAEVINAQEREIRHNKYKRCLAIAKSCKDLHDRYKVEYDSDEGFGDGMLKWIRWATKWQKRWLKIAEQFKEVK